MTLTMFTMEKTMTDTNIDAKTSTTQQPTTKPKLTIAMVQDSFMVGAINANANKMKRLAVKARDAGADMIVFPELALLGYPPEDLLLRPSLTDRVKNALASLAEVKDIVMIVGYPHIDHHGSFNSLAILHNGQQRGFYHKQHLPNYGVFDEERYFETGRNNVLFDYKGIKIGLLICEDLWQKQPIAKLKEEGAELIVSIHASPYETNKQTERKQVVTSRAKDNSLPVLYVNCVGGQDDLVFDGGSMAVNANGDIAVEAPRFKPSFLLTKFDGHAFANSKPPLQLSQEAEIYQALVVGLRDYVKNSGFKGVIVGLSGGIDSALTLCIAVDALGAESVYAVMMPYQYTSKISLQDAEAQARRLNVSYTVCPIHQAVNGMMATLKPLFGDTAPDTTEENLQARARGMILMALSNKFGQLVITTGNKSEMAVGYATLYGDMAGGFDVLKDVYKTQVYQLANYRNRIEDNPVIPERVITRPPSAELRPDQTDQDSLPDYDVLDKILDLYIDQDYGFKAIVEKGFKADTVRQIISMVDKSEYKRRQAAIGSKISRRAFGRERRYPLVNGWQAGGQP